MNSSLDSIWDEPLSQDSPKRTNPEQDDADTFHRPAKRARPSLFLADSDDEHPYRPPPPQDVDMDALFADIDDDMDMQPLPPRIDEQELIRQAEMTHRRNIQALTPHEILPSSSPPPDPSSGEKRTGGTDKGNAEKAARRKLVKLDENRLLNPTTGFPQLIKMTKGFKLKGKGHEATDLNRLLQQYQYWTHQLYPKTQFRDTVERVEKLCHSRRMNVSLSVWRDEAHGRPRRDDDDSVDEDENPQRQAEITEANTPSSPAPRSSPSRLSLRGLSPSPATSQTDHLPMPPQREPRPPSDLEEEDEQEAFWKSLDEFADDSSNAQQVPTTAANSSVEGDDYMWDILDDVETTSSTKPSIPTSVPPQPTNTAEAVANPSTYVADDWDDMYL
ncbi:hypothetical protein M413DRAFT_438233 [Hebeloma cylindrosporum]|uniref:Chromosome segregation in meiosis protein n=1 Tax=Hebeloma cylindrosporum TaxID=76867 RepID=A0A0C3CK24_HEBCY|nr:hypothetical protein M413DRAFT_438233 [Hebeloma cylindrosporum h7]